MLLSCSPFPPTPPYTCDDAPLVSHSARYFLQVEEELPPFATVNPQQGGVAPHRMEKDDFDGSGAAHDFAYPSPTFGSSSSSTPAYLGAAPLLEYDPSPEIQSLFDNFPSLPTSPYSSFAGTPYSPLFATPGSWSHQGGSVASTSSANATPNFPGFSWSATSSNSAGDYGGPSPSSTSASPASDAPVGFASTSSAAFESPELGAVGRPVRERKRSSASLGRSQSTTKRKPTETRYDPSIPYPLNSTHDFVVYKLCLRKLDVSERWVTKLTLVVAPPASPLERVVWGLQTYSRADYDEHCSAQVTYVFEDADSGLWDVVYSSTGPSITPRTPPTSSTSTPAPIYTFIHFPPGTMTASGRYPIGHRHWWRVQACVGNGGARHRSMPADGPGEWTARYDVQDDSTEPRRPARCVEHFAQCHLRTHDALFPLSVLARAIRKTIK